VLWLVIMLVVLNNSSLAYPHPVCSQCKERHRSKSCSKKPNNRSLVCAKCDQQLLGKTYRFQKSGLSFCAACYETSLKCDICQKPVELSKGGRKLSDGRVLCNIDNSKAKASEKRGHEILRLTEKELQLTFPGVFSLSPSVQQLYLVPNDVLSRGMGLGEGAKGAHLGGFARIEQTSVGEKVHNKPATIYLLDGRPLENILASSAHEHAHVWQSQRNPKFIQCSQEFREGFAEWVAYKVNRRKGRLDLAKRQQTYQRGVYTTGLEKFIKLEQRIGASKVLEFATTNLTF
jgi:hypothetical protein